MKLVAKWQAVGFTHGVLNTDNMSMLGDTIDYGPFGFIERFDPNFTPNTTDFAGRRYAFRNQPQVVQWNLMALATSLVTVGLIEKVNLATSLVTVGLIEKVNFATSLVTVGLIEKVNFATSLVTVGLIEKVNLATSLVTVGLIEKVSFATSLVTVGLIEKVALPLVVCQSVATHAVELACIFGCEPASDDHMAALSPHLVSLQLSNWRCCCCYTSCCAGLLTCHLHSP